MAFVLSSPSCFNEKCTFNKSICVIVVASRYIQFYGDYSDDVDNLFVVLSFYDKKGDLLMFG